MDDAPVVAIQIGRPPRSDVHVVARCHLGLPVATRVPPLLDDGTPFPTSYWLTCPLATVRISRLESAGGVKHADAELVADADLAARFAAATERYRTERDSDIPDDHTGPRPRGGIAGSSGGVKCLHAQYADTVAGNDNPIGARVASLIEPLDCATTCVTSSRGQVVANEQWVEPGTGPPP